MPDVLNGPRRACRRALCFIIQTKSTMAMMKIPIGTRIKAILSLLERGRGLDKDCARRAVGV